MTKNVYRAGFNGKEVVVEGEGLDLWDAKQQAIKLLQGKMRKKVRPWSVYIMLVAKDDVSVVHKPLF